MPFCPNCGVKVGEEGNFCYSCGVELRELKVQKICPNCGVEIDKGDNYCFSCGIKIVKEQVGKTKKRRRTLYIVLGISISLLCVGLYLLFIR